MLQAHNEKREVPRQRTLKGGQIVLNSGWSTINCTVRNLSAKGAKLELNSIVGVPDSFELLLQGQPRRASQVIWRTPNEIGVAFETIH
jgi:hypothetical protein